MTPRSLDSHTPLPAAPLNPAVSRGARADLKLLKGATDLPADAQEAALARIKKEGADAKKNQQKALNAKRNAPGAKAGQKAEQTVSSPGYERAKPSLADFLTPAAGLRAK